MIRFFVTILTLVLALMAASEIVPGLTIDNLTTAIYAAVILGALNSLVKPVLIWLTFPITILTLGLFILVINVCLFALVAWLLPGLTVSSVWSALAGTVIVSFISLFVQKMINA